MAALKVINDIIAFDIIAFDRTLSKQRLTIAGLLEHLKITFLI